MRVFALGGVYDTLADTHATVGEEAPAPQLGYARLGALTYFAPNTFALEPVIIAIHGVPVGICGLGTPYPQVSLLIPWHLYMSLARLNGLPSHYLSCMPPLRDLSLVRLRRMARHW